MICRLATGIKELAEEINTQNYHSAHISSRIIRDSPRITFEFFKRPSCYLIFYVLPYVYEF